MSKRSTCPHVTSVGSNSWQDVHKRKAQQDKCLSCGVEGPNLWLCLHAKCLYVGCGESAVDHSSTHAETTSHCLTLNLTTMRIWCYVCESEVFKDSNTPPLVMAEQSIGTSSGQSSPQRICSMTPTPTPTPDDSSDEDEEAHKPRVVGLTGLQNIGNTCYMNAAIQALSNCVPLTRFFLDCPGFVRTDKKLMLSRSYMKLMNEMWHKKRPGYVIPSSVAHGIKTVHPMFRGYSQQDTQEFLRCFMDQLHEELKSPVAPDVSDEASDETHQATSTIQYQMGVEDVKTHSAVPPPENNSQSDTDYETCDSGLSSERSSVENSLSGDEINEPNEQDRIVADKNRANVNNNATGICTRHDKNRIQPDEMSVASSRPDSGISTAHSESSLESLKTLTKKDAKDSANFASQQLTNEAFSSQSSDTSPSTPEDGIEFSDAVSELEPLQGQQRTSSAPTRLRHTPSESERMSAMKNTVTQSCPNLSRKKKSVLYSSIISDTFDGKILSSVQCLTCERISSTKETFQDVSLPIPSKDHIHMLHASQQSAPHSMQHKGTCGEVTLNQGWFSWMFGWMKSWIWGPTITLQDCLAAFFSADELKGDNMYSCEKCKKLRTGVKYSKVLEQPEILCIHLKRFRHEFMFSSKISSYVSFPMENLDLSPYKHKDCKDNTLYDLISVICHHGTAGGGHYTAYALNAINEQWYEFDDQYVTEVDTQTVENCEAYVLFYRKKNLEMTPLRQKAEEIISSSESSIMKFFVSRQWINKFKTFSDPGPISNRDFLCRHGGVPPSKWSFVNELTLELAQPVWEFLHEQFGGGPAVNHLYQCTTCQMEIEKLKNRQHYEMKTFIQLNDDFQNEDNPGTIYAISMMWFKDWENFVRERTDESPGPIDNTKIAVQKSGQWTIKLSSDYGQLSEEMWRFLFDIYGGGPELILKQNPPTLLQESAKSSERETRENSGKTVETKM